MTLYLKILQMMHHPVKRFPLPYIYATLNLTSNEEQVITKKSNAVPPCWNSNTFKFNVRNLIFDENINENEKKLRITIIESRLFMVEEPLGFCDIIIPSLPQDRLLIQWATLIPSRPYLQKMMILLMIQLNSDEESEFEKINQTNINIASNDKIIFNAPLVSPENILQFEPWDPREVDLKYLKQIQLDDSILHSKAFRDNSNDITEDKYENVQDASMYQSSLKEVLEMFS